MSEGGALLAGEPDGRGIWAAVHKDELHKTDDEQFYGSAGDDCDHADGISDGGICVFEVSVQGAQGSDGDVFNEQYVSDGAVIDPVICDHEEAGDIIHTDGADFGVHDVYDTIFGMVIKRILK